MKRLYLLLTALLTLCCSYAQLNYQFAPQSGSYQALVGATTPTVVNSHQTVIWDTHDEGYVNSIPIGFNFIYNGIAYSTINANTNGFASFALFTPIQNNSTQDYYTADLAFGPYGANTVRPILAPLWDDHDLFSTTDIKYLTTGVSPNRVFTLQWSRVYWDASATALNIEFQLKLIEGTNVIEFHYNRLNGALGNNPTAAIGITATGTGTGNYLALSDASASPTASSSINYFNISTKPATGQIYRFTPTCNSDVTPPEITPKNATVNADASGHASITPGTVIEYISDNCAVDFSSLKVSPNQFTCVPNNGDGDHQAYVSPTSNGVQNWTGELGMEFRVNDPNGIIISKLGAFDHQGNGISGTQSGGVRVAIFNKSTMTIVPGLDATIVGTLNPLVNKFRFKAVAPVTLAPGDYVVVAKGYNNNELNGNYYAGSPIATGDLDGGAISYIGTSRYGNADPGTFGYPNNPDFGPANQYLAGTFIYTKAGTGNGNVYTVTITAKDVNGNTATANATVTIVCDGSGDPCANDQTPPVIVTKNASVHADANGNASIAPSDVIQSISDNCAVDNAATSVTPTQFTCTAGSGDGDHQAYVSPTSNGVQNWTGELGMEFRVNDPAGIQISQLGAFDHQGNGINGTQSGGVRVAIFNKTTMAIVPGLDVTIAGTTDPLVNKFRFKSIAPVALAPGDYVVVAKGYNNNELNGNSYAGSPIAPGDLDGGAISYIGTSRYGNADPSTFGYPNNPDFGSPYQYHAGTFIYTKGGSGNTHTVTITAKDMAGNLSTATATVTVICDGNGDPCVNDRTPPVIVSKNVTVFADANGNASIQPSDVIQSITDNCAVDNSATTVSPTQFTCSSGNTDGIHQAYVAPTNRGSQNWTGELGMEFRVNNPGGISISELGAFDHLGNGINGTQSGGVRVAVFNKSTMTIVPGLDVIITGTLYPLSNNFRFRPVSPVTLPTGDYVIVAKGYNDNELNGNYYTGSPIAPGDQNSGAISYIGTSRYGTADPGTFAYPANPDFGPAYQYLAGTFKYTKAGGNNTHTVTITAKDLSGNTSTKTATVTVNCSAATAPAPVVRNAAQIPAMVEQVNAGVAKVFPNPTRGQFTVQVTELSDRNVTIQVLNANGMLVAQKTVSLSGNTSRLIVPFDITRSAPGMYLVKVITSKGIEVQKIVLQP